MKSQNILGNFPAKIQTIQVFNLVGNRYLFLMEFDQEMGSDTVIGNGRFGCWVSASEPML